MSALHTPTATEKRRADRELLVYAAAEAAHNLASVLKSCHSRFWTAEPVQLAADLNADPAAALAMMGGNAMLGAAVNAQLDALNLPQYPSRAPIEIGGGFAYTPETGFVYTAPPEPEEEE
tara:strand:- start:37 stop:396 length:360 start_codon:yes stop_codon:yes gene_type:complete